MPAYGTDWSCLLARANTRFSYTYLLRVDSSQQVAAVPPSPQQLLLPPYIPDWAGEERPLDPAARFSKTKEALGKSVLKWPLHRVHACMLKQQYPLTLLRRENGLIQQAKG